MSGLLGRRIVVTRAAHQAREFAELVQKEGATPLLYPCIHIVPTESAQLGQSLRGIQKGDFDWLILTSINTVHTLASFSGIDFSRVKTACVGPETKRAAQKTLGINPSLVPEQFQGEGLLKCFDQIAPSRILLPQSSLARPILAEGLEKRGHFVEQVKIYQSVAPSPCDGDLVLINQPRPFIITFFSPSSVRFFKKRFEAEGGCLEMLDTCCIACIGSITQQEAERIGFRVDVTPKNQTGQGLIESLKDVFQ